MPTTPRLYQREGASAIERFGGCCVIGDEPGLGKSLQALLYAVRNPELRPMVVVCPASLKYQWQNECSKHFNLLSEVLEGTRPPKKGLVSPHPIIILNFDILHCWLAWLKKLKPKLVVVDEIHYCQSRRARRSKMTKLLCEGVNHRIGLTGTLITNRPAEAWFPLHIIKPELFPTWWGYASKFTDARLRPWGWTFDGAKNTEELHRILVRNVLVRRLKKDVLEQLPPKERTVLPLPIEDRKQYKKAETDFIAWLSERSLAQAKKASKAEKLSQLGHLKRLAGLLKLKYVIEWVDNRLQGDDQKIILFAVHKAVIKRLAEHYAGRCVVVDGGVVKKARQAAVDRFQTDPKIRVLIGSKAAWIGLNLTAAYTEVFCELGWTPGEHLQAEDRAYARLSDLHGVTVVYMVGKKTIEERLCEIIQRKSKIVNAVLDGDNIADEVNIHNQLLESYWKENVG